MLLKEGKSPNITLGNGWTPLMIAVAEGHKDVVRLLIERGANVNARNKLGRTPIMFAARYGYTEIVQLLADAGAELNAIASDMTPLMAASMEGHTETVKKLISLGADVNVLNSVNDDALQLAVEKAHHDVAKTLLENEALPNRQNTNGVHPLQMAIFKRDDTMVNILLQNRADPNIVTRLNKSMANISFQGEDPNTISQVEKHLEKNGDILVSPLMFAAQLGNAAIASALLKKGANVNFKNNLGETPLSYARLHNKKEVERILIMMGASE